MEARVNDFLNEINEIVPPVTQIRSTAECAWQECFDDTTGFPYYWNMLTNAVTWEIPSEYQAYLDKTKAQNAPSTKPAKKPLFPSATNSTATIEESKTIIASKVETTSCQEVKKIKALPAYILDSDHDSQEALSRNGSNTNSPLHTNSKSNSQANSDIEQQEDLKPTLGFSLLANYGNYSDEDSQDEEAINSEEPSKTEVHSVLFPVTQPIDVRQFEHDKKCEKSREKRENPQEVEEIDVKAFKRKRRIGVHLVNHPKKATDGADTTDGNEKNDKAKESLKNKFGMTFVKGDTLHPTISTEKTEGEEPTNETSVIKEKLAFLSEGKDVVSPVQVMSIQLEILFSAWKSGNLNSTYFSSWIKEISSDLIKLEEDAAPEGWNLEWDRQEKRYFYRNQSSDECQWEYPQTHSVEAVNGDGEAAPVEERQVLEEPEDDAMDICTTPPPMDAATDGSNIEVTTICGDATDETGSKNEVKVDLTSALDSFYSDIATIEAATVKSDLEEKNKEVPETKEKEETKKKEVSTVNNTKLTVTGESSTVEPVKKRKKVKMSHGISMKKKGVSQLVEKWKNVQKDLD